jgi:hypothetical protein
MLAGRGWRGSGEEGSQGPARQEAGQDPGGATLQSSLPSATGMKTTRPMPGLASSALLVWHQPLCATLEDSIASSSFCTMSAGRVASQP